MGETGGWIDRAVRVQLDRSNLTAERERELLRRVGAENGCPSLRQAAFTELWESHSKLVVAIASRYRRPQFDLLDLVGVGHLGLHTAITRFDPDRYATRLSTYAIGWIRWFIQDHIRRNTGPVRLPASAAHRQLAQMGEKLLADARRHCQRERVEATDSELHARIGRRIGLPADEVARSLGMIQGGTLSLHQRADEGDAPALEETLSDPLACPEEEAILRLDRAKARGRIMTLMNEILGERERIVFRARCMTDGGEMVPLDSLAARFGVTRERVHQLETSAKRKIATALAREGFGDTTPTADPPPRLPPVRARRRRSAPIPPRHRETAEIVSAAG